jgi:hypothetical protein
MPSNARHDNRWGINVSIVMRDQNPGASTSKTVRTLTVDAGPFSLPLLPSLRGRAIAARPAAALNLRRRRNGDSPPLARTLARTRPRHAGSARLLVNPQVSGPIEHLGISPCDASRRIEANMAHEEMAMDLLRLCAYGDPS